MRTLGKTLDRHSTAPHDSPWHVTSAAHETRHLTPPRPSRRHTSHTELSGKGTQSFAYMRHFEAPSQHARSSLLSPHRHSSRSSLPKADTASASPSQTCHSSQIGPSLLNIPSLSRPDSHSLASCPPLAASAHAGAARRGACRRLSVACQSPVGVCQRSAGLRRSSSLGRRRSLDRSQGGWPVGWPVSWPASRWRLGVVVLVVVRRP